jgi:ATP-dependent helicase/nuclease subunit A
VFFEKLRANRSSRLTPAMLVLTYQKEEAQAERQAEARWIAAEIVRLHQEGQAFKEMVLLFKAMTPVELYAAALQQAGVPYVIVDGRGFYERQEVIDLMNLLAVLLDAGDNLALTAVLRSPYFGLDDETLTRLYLKPQAAGENFSLWQSLAEAAGAAKLTDERVKPQTAAGFSFSCIGGHFRGCFVPGGRH